MNDDEKKALFNKMFNHEKTAVEHMSESELDEHIEELTKIAYEAKARILAGQQLLAEMKQAGKVH